MSLSDELFSLSFKDRIPLYTTLEITYRCNLSCIHCYIPKEYRNLRGEITYQQTRKVIKQIADVGGLYLVFTGGEPLLREDIFDLIAYAKKLKFVVILFTNGTLVDSNVARKIKLSGVDKVEISLYGDREVHNKITKGDWFDKTVNGIGYLRELGIKVAIKLPIMKPNYKGYKFIRKYVQKNGLEVKFDFVLAPKNDGNKDPQKYIISCDKIKDLLREYFKGKRFVVDNEDIFSNLICSAGRNIVGISAKGDIYPCLQFPYVMGNIKEKSFYDIWYDKRKIDFVLNQKFEDFIDCKGCKLLVYCSRCPGISYVETRSFFRCSTTAKFVAKVVKEYAKSIS